MADRFQVQNPEGETRDYLVSQVPYNNTVYVYAPSIIPPKKEISDFFFEQGKQVYMRDLEYYSQQWEARRPDVFISHDSADKSAVAEPLYHALTAKGLKVWLDKYTLNLGDSLTEKINEGIAECRYGVLILSKAFLANERWAKRELNSFSVKDAIGDSHKLIPVWHGISEQDLAATGNYWLIDKLGGSASDIEKLANDIARVVTNP
ncbi:MAG: toll/interleukin-1 receptor domain-containing protein [Hymenobacter sp.]|nr:MAG: toll/interleukin-1 receptor domain-containing protein [Hymenobacter sp.]